MSREQKLTSFGLFLQTARIENKMSIEALSAETRIRVEVLKRLEAEQHEHLPNEVFVRGFIRNYAHAVGADVEEALERYRANFALRSIKIDRKAVASTHPNRFWLGLVTAVGAVLLVAVLTLYIYARLNAPSELPGAASIAPIEKKHASPAEKPAVEKTARTGAASAPSAALPSKKETQDLPQQYILEIKAVEETWLKIIVDDQKAQELVLQADEVRQIQATTLFNLLIGNAGGVELKLNGAPVDVTGKSGQVVNIQLP